MCVSPRDSPTAYPPCSSLEILPCSFVPSHSLDVALQSLSLSLDLLLVALPSPWSIRPFDVYLSSVAIPAFVFAASSPCMHPCIDATYAIFLGFAPADRLPFPLASIPFQLRVRYALSRPRSRVCAWGAWKAVRGMLQSTQQERPSKGMPSVACCRGRLLSS
jgi:hypothetical protein